ncbi:MAG: hypothetical protein Phog2KO_36570 [Phototrophicaceae bacterium]
MKFRNTVLTLVALFTLLVAGVANAQDDMGIDPCFGLDADNCAVINEASANGVGDAESFTVDFSIDFTGTDVDSIFGLVGSLAGDPSAAEDAVSSVTFTLDSTIDVAQSDSFTGIYLAGDFVLTSSTDDGEVEEQVIEVLIVDDVLYIADGGDEGEWMSINLLEVLSDEDVSEGVGDLMASAGDTSDLGVDPSSFTALLSILDLPGFLTYERAGDDFVFNIDFAVLQQLLEEDNEELLNELVTAAAEVEPTLAFFIPAIPTLINSGNFTVTQTVDTSTSTINNIAVGSNLDLALGALTGTTDVTNLDLLVNIGIGNIDGVSQVAAPAEATDITGSVLGSVGSVLGTGAGE